MKALKIQLHNRIINRWLLLPCISILCLYSCEIVSLEEKPLSLVSDAAVLTSPKGFELFVIGLNERARQEFTEIGIANALSPTDMFNNAGLQNSGAWDWVANLNPMSGRHYRYWTWAYTQMLPQANSIIYYGSKPELQSIWSSEEERKALIAEAYFFRGWTYLKLAHLFGGVPIVDQLLEGPRYDYVRASRKEVYEFAKADMEFASKWLPATVPTAKEGRIVKAAADHVLTEIYICLGEYDNAVSSASRVIDSGLYHLMTTRFGTEKSKPGDPFSDLFKLGNTNRSSGNMESIYVWQFEEYTEGGGPSSRGNGEVRIFLPMYVNISDPAKYAMLVTDSIGRGIGQTRGSNYALYDIWQDDWNDMRNSSYNMRRVFYYNNPKSPYYLTKVQPEHLKNPNDTLRHLYPYSRKPEGPPWQGALTSGGTEKDRCVIRLAETYLLRAEAFLRKGDKNNSAKDINVVRARAKVKPVAPENVTIEYILDERARELMAEELRNFTLMRMGKLVERVRLYDIVEVSRATIQNYHNLWPIPQTAIDANIGVVLEQNPGY